MKRQAVTFADKGASKPVMCFPIGATKHKEAALVGHYGTRVGRVQDTYDDRTLSVMVDCPLVIPPRARVNFFSKIG
jgi:succinyl-CoA synthetase alpha subunit